uniref:Uncharacterized protein n=1 Tax=Panagrolaimus davidi TaxID=227884 RepID=A0A914PJI3_9BILA
MPPPPPVSSRNLTLAVPLNAASFNIDPTRRDENNGRQLTIRTSGPGNSDPSEQLQTTTSHVKVETAQKGV